MKKAKAIKDTPMFKEGTEAIFEWNESQGNEWITLMKDEVTVTLNPEVFGKYFEIIN